MTDTMEELIKKIELAMNGDEDVNFGRADMAIDFVEMLEQKTSDEMSTQQMCYILIDKKQFKRLCEALGISMSKEHEQEAVK